VVGSGGRQRLPTLALTPTAAQRAPGPSSRARGFAIPVGRAHTPASRLWRTMDFGHEEPARTGVLPPGNGIWSLFSCGREVGSGSLALLPAPNALSGTGSGDHGRHASAESRVARLPW
jgi:hypothetical protein